MKHRYRIRPLSPLWWFTRVGGGLLTIVGCYSLMLLAFYFAP